MNRRVAVARLYSACIFCLFLGLASVAEGQSGGIVYYSRTDGAVAGVDITSKTAVSTLSPALFQGANPGAAREIAFDPFTRIMWYSSTDNTIRSVNVDSGGAGPTITDTPGAAIGADRHLFIDYAGRRLLVPSTDGSVQMYALSNQAKVGVIPSSVFTDGNVGASRHFASDIRTGNVWYAATDGSFRELNPNTAQNTGRTISFAAQTGANPGAFRHMVVDPGNNRLLYNVTDGSLASINLTTLGADTYTISAAAFSGANPGAGRIITGSFDFLPAPQFTAAGLVNGANYRGNGVAPGEIVSAFGGYVGPPSPVFAGFNAQGMLDTTLLNTRVLFDGVAAPMIYAQHNQLNLVVPYSVTGKTSTQVQVEYKGVKSAAVTVPVVATAPGIFSLDSSGNGPGAILNQNQSVNSAANPESRGNVIVIYATGEGQTSPAGVDGKPAVAPYPVPLAAVTVTIGGVPAQIEYAGAAPGFVGLLQVNARIPASVTVGSAVAVVVTIGGVASNTVTVAVK